MGVDTGTCGSHYHVSIAYCLCEIGNLHPLRDNCNSLQIITVDYQHPIKPPLLVRGFAISELGYAMPKTA